MVDRDESDLVAYVAGQPSRVALALRDAPDPGAAVEALRRAAAAVRGIPHPDEPDEPLANWLDVQFVDGVPVLSIDLQDQAGFAREVVGAVVTALDANATVGRLEPFRAAVPAYEYDAGADILPGVEFLPELDVRGLPPAFPRGFPVPADGVLVLAQRARGDTWQHAAWRGDQPFDAYPERLRDFGCELEPVEARDRLMVATGMIRLLFRHRLGTGSVSTYHEMAPPGGFGRTRPSRWYVSVVWRPADRR